MSNAETVLAAFHDAQHDAGAVDWQALAAALAAAIPAPKRRKADPNAVPAWWHAAPLPRAYHTESCDVAFADGQTVRVTATRAPGKPWAVERAVRGAVGFWHARTRSDGAVPAVVSIGLADGSEAWDAETVTRLSEAIRAPLPPTRPVAAPVTVATLARLTAEYDRRKAGLARAHAAERAHGHRPPEGFVPSSEWLRALKGIRAEIAACREALAPARPAPAQMLAIAGPVARVPLCSDAIAEGLALAYGDPEAWELAGTFDALDRDDPVSAGATVATSDRALPTNDLDPDPVSLATSPAPTDCTHPHPEGMATCPAVGEPCRAGCSHRSGCGRPTYHTHEPAEPFGETWGPTDESHPVVALCLSDAAWLALSGAILDGTAPAPGRRARAGAWRVSLADARELQGIPSIRWVGMPRKAYTRRAAPPLNAIGTPLNAITVPVNASRTVPHPAYIPGAGRTPAPVTFHAAP